MAGNSMTIPEKELKRLVVERLTDVGMPERDAAIVAEVLVFADMRGVHSHGVLRVEHYTKRIKAGGMNLHPELRVDWLKPSIALLDAHGGAGHVSTRLATEEAIRVSHEQGIAVVGIRNNSHCGALAYYVDMALQENLASIVCANTNSSVAPFGGQKAFLGTNPFAFGFPGKSESILLDMATSEVAFGKIFLAREKNEPIPTGWALDEEGNGVTDPKKAVTLFPFGGAKGYGIGVMVEALTGLMIGGIFGPHVKEMYGQYESYRDLANFVWVIDPSVFGSSDYFLELTQHMIDELHAQPPARGVERVMIPGEIERRNFEQSARVGIEVPTSVYRFLSGGNGSGR
ncbi:MAG TPA: Ldh family oxidoreductase [Spirochaetia bacterium]|nr:Ldh family oxidoreductase [Spirochaetia bacterium]